MFDYIINYLLCRKLIPLQLWFSSFDWLESLKYIFCELKWVKIRLGVNISILMSIIIITFKHFVLKLCIYFDIKLCMYIKVQCILDKSFCINAYMFFKIKFLMPRVDMSFQHLYVVPGGCYINSVKFKGETIHLAIYCEKKFSLGGYIYIYI